MAKKRIRPLNTRFHLPTVRGNKRVFRYVIWSIFGMILLLSLLSILKYSGISSRLQVMEQQWHDMRSKTQANVPVNPRLLLYMDAFIPIYIGFAPENIDKREKELANYLATGLKDTTTASNTAKRIFKKAILFEVKDAVASYIVEYVNVLVKKTSKAVQKKDAKGNVIAGVEDEETKSEHPVKSLLHIPYEEKNGQYGIRELPYFTTIPNLMTTSLPMADSLPRSSNLDVKKNEEVKAFVDDFLRKYTTQPASDLSYMMKEPESVQGLYKYVSSTPVAVQEGEHVVVYVEVQLEEKSAPIEHVERMKLVLVKKDNKYVVKKLVYQGGR